ncbi:MAG: hypothetical protein JWM14_2062 [Chitinophagaceae bacterium]|nr:hypothetical protein [Chitinophagaceae bacterium]
MKMCVLNSCFFNRFNSFLMVTTLCLVLFTFCKSKKCEGLDAATEQFISPGIKTALGFPDTTRWVFECVSTGARDTIFLGEQEFYPLEKGDCALMSKGKCCSDYYYEKSNRNLTVHSTSGLNNFSNYYTDEEGLGIKGDWGKILILNHIYSQDFLQRFTQSLTLTISPKVLSDTRSGEQYVDDSTPFQVYWSKEYGLVKYTYKTATDTLKYERVNFP